MFICGFFFFFFFFKKIRYLYKQLMLFYSSEPELRERSVFQSTPIKLLLQLKPKIYLHLYTNKTPKGAAQHIMWVTERQCISVRKIQIFLLKRKKEVKFLFDHFDLTWKGVCLIYKTVKLRHCKNGLSINSQPD